MQGGSGRGVVVVIVDDGKPECVNCFGAVLWHTIYKKLPSSFSLPPSHQVLKSITLTLNQTS